LLKVQTNKLGTNSKETVKINNNNNNVYNNKGNKYFLFTQHPPGETSCTWLGWVYTLLAKTLAGWPESCGECS